MLPEQLLQPRYKVIADYPQPPFNEESDEHKFIEGDIMLYLRVNDHMTYKRIGRCGWMSVGVPCIAHPEKYPKIFRKMEWWEERRIEDMPEYVRHVNGTCYKIGKWKQSNSFGGIWFDETVVWLWSNVVYPTTEKEYNAYLNSK